MHSGFHRFALLMMVLLVLPAAAQNPPLTGAAREYNYMWWTNGLRDDDKSFSLMTARYAMRFEVPQMHLTYLHPILRPLPMGAALTQPDKSIFLEPNATLTCTLHVGDKSFRAESASADYTDSHLIEAGRLFSRRTIEKLNWSTGAPEMESALEVSGWTERLAFILCITPKVSLKDARMELRVAGTPAFQAAAEPAGAVAYGDTAQIAHLAIDAWPAGVERRLAIVLTPLKQPAEQPVVSARQIAPKETDLRVTYDPFQGWYRVDLRNDNTGQAPFNDRMERVRFKLKNPSASAQWARLCFAKDQPDNRNAFDITGISAMIRDSDGYPTGIPVQVSKNWHTGKPARYAGPWYRGLTMVPLGPGQEIELEYTSVNALYGGVPAVSYAQLCLSGWGNNQLWNEAAIGAWGESICFEPDQGQTGGAVLDTRPLMVWAMSEEPKTKWGWTCNVGGADFLVYHDAAGKKVWNSGMRTMYRRTGPVLAEVTYAGHSHDQAIDLQYTTMLYRTDDLTRGLYHFRYDVRKKVSFSRLVFFQAGGDDYSYTGEKKFAWGNETGLKREWDTQWGGDVYRTEPVEWAGRVPWVSMHQAVARRTRQEAWADRGLVLRSWNARVGGREASPFIAERGAKVRGTDTSLLDVVPPPGTKELLPGDFVEGTIEHIVMPQFADDYYGPNAALHAALEKDQDTWRMIQREAMGNDIKVAVSVGQLERLRPTMIQPLNGRAEFTITGGVGYVPFTITGLKNYRVPVLEQEVAGTWKTVDQSAHGKDFWQTDVDPATGKWEISYSVPGDQPAPMKFRFRME